MTYIPPQHLPPFLADDKCTLLWFPKGQQPTPADFVVTNVQTPPHPNPDPYWYWHTAVLTAADRAQEVLDKWNKVPSIFSHGYIYDETTIMANVASARVAHQTGTYS